MLEVRYIYSFNGQPVNEYTLDNGKYKISILNLGAAVTKIIARNASEKLESILLRYHDYKFYRDNPYFLGALVNTVEDLNKDAVITSYFECLPVENGLEFSCREEDKVIKVLFFVAENSIVINYDNNINLKLSHVLFFNLSGNVKEDIRNHTLVIDNEMIDYTHDFDCFKMLPVRRGCVRVEHPNGIVMDLKSCSHIFLSNGGFFKEPCLINQGKEAEKYSGLGVYTNDVRKLELAFSLKRGGKDENL